METPVCVREVDIKRKSGKGSFLPDGMELSKYQSCVSPSFCFRFYRTFLIGKLMFVRSVEINFLEPI
jgi:hypothetical protein